VDTDTSLADVVQTDSATSYLQSEAMVTAARQLKAKILEAGAAKLGAGSGDLDIADGRVFVKSSPDRGIDYADALWADHLVPVAVTVSEPPNDEKTGVPFFAHFAEVEVDTATGKIDVIKLVIVTDCGTVMFPSGAEGQQLGAQCQGVGEALTEEIVYDERTGVPLNFNWIDYQIPTALDLPAIEPVLMEVWQGAGEYGASGLGEGALTPTPRAIANAVYNAIGARIDDIPIKPEKVLRALAKLGAEGAGDRGPAE
jgi:CO/xanthine dehydrogenase Mo-binding subunit